MKLTKQLEAEIINVNNNYWDSYMKGDWQKTSSFLDDHIKMIGSTEGEVYNNKKEATEFFKHTAREVAGKIDMRNREIEIIPADPYVMVNEHLDLYIYVKKQWVFYSKVRLTSLLKHTEKGWKFIQQHGSVPDAKVMGNETIAFQQIAKENLELKEAVKRRTTELEQKNHELVIEAALERVRSQALGMKKAEDLLNVCEVLFRELQQLGFAELRNTMINIFDDANGSFLNYDYSGYAGKTITNLYYNTHPVIEKQVKQARSSADAFSEAVFRGKDLEDWKAFRRKAGEADDPRVEKIASLFYYFYSIGTGVIGISTYHSISGDKRNVLKRFRNLFDLAYRRFLDIQKAEEQAKEAQIEAALEKIRSRSLAMRHSDELREVIGITHKMLGELKVKHDTIAIQVFDFKNKSSVFWPGNNLQDVAPKVILPYDESIMKEDTCHRDLWEAMSTGEAIINKVYTKRQKDRWFEYVFAHNNTQVIVEQARHYILNAETHTVCFFPEKYSGLFADSWDGSQYIEADLNVLKRAARVFEQAYVRFLDLQKAEAQARESQIQLALERVRARTMAMHHSDELTDVVKMLYQEFDKLNISNESTDIEIGLIDEETGVASMWAHFYLSDGTISTFKFPLTYIEEVNNEFNIWKATPVEKRNELFLTTVFSGDQWERIIRIAEDLPELAEIFRPLIEAKIEKWITHNAYFSHGFLTLQGTEAYSPETQDIQKRFAKVFEQTYTRFLDLQKAEAQARDAEIELALERVRSRAMAMHSSQELKDVATELRNQISALGQTDMEICAIHLYDESPDYFESIAAGPVFDPTLKVIQVQVEVKLPKHGIRIIEEMMNQYHSGKKDYVLVNQGEKGVEWFELLKEKVPLAYEFVKQNLKGTPLEELIYYWSVSDFKGGALVMTTYVPPADEVRNILRRFSNVFGLAYQRFKDIKQAEAQAREAKIEMALEKIRSRTMAMQHSDELPEAANLLFLEVQALGIPAWSCGYNVLAEDKKTSDCWMSSEGAIQEPFNLYFTEEASFIEWYNFIQSDENFFVQELGGEALVQHYNYMRNIPKLGEVIKKLEDAGISLPTYQINHLCKYAYGFLLFITYEPVPDAHDLFKRFTKVFEQTYTRFLDLQKAEAQAREAQIETALERVRSRSMAMHKSDELKEVIRVVLEQFVHLNINVGHAGFYIDYKAHDDMHIWLADPNLEPFYAVIPYFDTPTWNSFMEAKAKGITLHTDLLDFKTKNKFYRSLFKLFEIPEKAKEFYLQCKGLAVSTVLLDSVGLYIENFDGTPYTDEENNILIRFGQVFQQAYTRFLDLQKAETQAREAQIEAALERVRSRTMAMHKSDELIQTAELLFDQLRQLGAELQGVAFAICDNNSVMVQKWTSIGVFSHPYTIEPGEQRMYEAWKNQSGLYEEVYEGERQRKYYEAFMEIPEFKQGLQKFIDAGYPLPTWQKNHAVTFKHGYLLFITTKPFDETQIFVRFGKVFEQTYTRFLDLQKAEAQAREAQIEAALERIRSKSLAMHHSSELSTVVDTLLQEFTKLEFSLTFCIINLINGDDLSNTVWAANPETGKDAESYYMKFEDYDFHRAMWNAWKAQDKRFVYTLQGEEKRIYDEYLYSETEFRRFPKHVQEANKALDRYVAGFTFFKYSGLQTVSVNEITDSELEILERFGRVFEQAYTRFLDLQKAEAQAREAQIEAALEKVRSRSLAMHKSDELREVVVVVFEKLKELGLTFDVTGIQLYTEGSKDIIQWVAALDLLSLPVLAKLPFSENDLMQCEIIRDIWTAKEKGESFQNKNYSFEDKNRFFEYAGRYNDNSIIPEEVREFQLKAQGYTQTLVAEKHSSLWVDSYSGQTVSPEEFNLLGRFARVFEQAYVRFLDLQKAEAQAREAQIEASLERVRSRSMAMHQSNDLHEVIKVVAEQFIALGLRFDTTNFANTLPDGSLDAWISTSVQAYPSQIRIPYFENRVYTEEAEMISSGKDFLARQYTVEEKNSFFRNFFENTVARNIPEERKQYVYNAKGYVRSIFRLKNIFFAIASYDGIPYSDEENAVFWRFAKVFEQAYIRFNDLQKAEAQAREAQIETALEKVRSRSLAMHKSDELLEVVNVIYEQLKTLGLQLWNCGFIRFHSKQSSEAEIWMTRPDGKMMGQSFVIPLDKVPVYKKLYEAWKNMEELHIESLQDMDIIKHHNSIASLNIIPVDKMKQAAGRELPLQMFFHSINFSDGILGVVTTEAVEDENVLLRFGNTFKQAYTRFLDLQKAEAQAREAQIEAALERVRSKTMAMHNSQDVGETVVTMFDEVVKLGIHSIRCGIGIFGDTARMELWTAKEGAKGKAQMVIGHLDMTRHPLLQGVYNTWKNKEKHYTYELAGNDLINYFNTINSETEYPIQYEINSLPPNQFHNSFYFPEGVVYVFSLEDLSEEAKKIFKRFAGVFGQTYRRYLDLQRAEAQAREAQIEAALERVRSRTMAMHKSSELLETSELLFDQLKQLGAELQGVAFAICDDNSAMVQKWTSIGIFSHPYTIEPGEQRMYEAWKNQAGIYEEVYEGERIRKYYEKFMEIPAFREGLQKFIDSGYPIPEWQKNHAVTFKHGYLLFITTKPFNETQIFLRFGKVFEQTYTRFLDLQKAETNAREAKIEAAMEKVRARAMAMQKPNELVEVAELLRKEMGLLGVEELETSSIYIHNENNGTTECWYAIQDIRDNEKKLVADYMTINLNDTWVGREMLNFYKSDQKQVSILMQGENRKEWINYCAEHSKFLEGYYGEVIPERTYHLLKFSNGYIGAASQGEISKESWDLLKRATTVFSLAYTRFSDLQIAEASAKEAIKQAALDRIRADIASMRTISDLDRITPLIWNELTVLGIPFIRCGVFIMDETQQLIHTFLSTPEGKAIAAFHLPYDTPGNLSKVLSHWKDHNSYIDHWDQLAFTEMADILVKQGAITSPGQYLDSIPHGGFYLHFLPFLQGMLYVGNTSQLGDDDIELIQHIADAFSTAYARYEDFNKLETAKQQVEKTLADLKQAQTQLVQSEKMASLGELTAGIAHEIQNPLNFVNNFSDVSNELIDEMKDELAKGNIDDAMAIAEDVKQNLEKINHHGKRADGIVKGMLQHSRSSTGQKEITDINMLADEYLRLAYHGLRAKDKSFNAKFETHFDDNIDKINIIPQDIGRVILNLINNAFYAVTEKKKQNIEGYEPTVTVSTSKLNRYVEIRVKDNGIGIPQKVLDKIFQPFFTTKPTGQGTGLGLSLAYDIITKGHGGELKVETKEGEGSEFTIQLPV